MCLKQTMRLIPTYPRLWNNNYLKIYLNSACHYKIHIIMQLTNTIMECLL